MKQNLMKQNKTGNTIVDAVGKMNLTGNVIPTTWYKTLRYANGKPNMNAIAVLAEIVYWYKPSKHRSENGEDISYKKKFADENYLQRSYDQISEKYGMTKRQAKDAIVFLEEEGVIKRHFRTVKDRQGSTLPNVLFIELFPERLSEITYGNETRDMPLKDNEPSEEDTLPKEDISSEGDTPSESNMSLNKKEAIHHSNDTSISSERDTNTENTTKTTTEDFVHPSINHRIERQMDQTSQEVKKLIPMVELIETYDYDDLCKMLTYRHLVEERRECKLSQYEIYERVSEELRYLISYDLLVADGQGAIVDALVDYMSEIISTDKSMSFKGETYTAQSMGNQFYRLDNCAIRHVLSKFEQASKETRINNPKSYLIRMLLTARSDMETSISSKVNYDMHHWN